ncbi:MAG: phosphatase PAP2 family protein [Clostridiales bacterium]|nr:phosphatase PAP2 family protein [Clostridiales bacterium]
MTKRYKRRTLQLIRIAYAAVLAAAIAVFTRFDLEFSDAVYTGETAFTKIFDVAGNFPALLIYTFLFAAAARLAKKKRFKGVFLALSGVFAALAVLKAASFSPNKWIYAVAAAPALPAALCFAFKHVKEETVRRLCCAFLITGIMVAVSALFVYPLKYFWGRARFYAVRAVPDRFPYSPWFRPQGPHFDWDGSSDTWLSFPSGHTMSACAFVAIPLCAYALNAKKRVTALCAVTTALVILCVLFSRVLSGMHYMTDTLFSLSICSAAFAFSIWVTNRMISPRDK